MPFHVLTAEFLHESNTFKKGTTTLRDFAAHVLYDGDAGLGSRLQANTEIGGFMAVAKAKNWTTTHVISAHAEPGGKVAREAYEHIAAKICAAVRAHKGQLNGILLALHGAMVTQDHQDGEGELLTRVRAITGPDLPIAITLDLHANATPAMARLADIVVAFKTYPHIDMTLTGTHAARLLHDMMAGKTRPRTLRTHRPMLDDTNAGRSDAGPIVPLYAAARAYETEHGILAVSLNAGFSDADIAEVGPTTFVTYDQNIPRAEARALTIANQLSDAVWAARGASENTFLDVPDTIALAQAHPMDQGPLIIADYSDNPGSGAYGDATNLLAGMIDAGLQNATFGPMIDPQAAAKLCAERVGDTLTIELGGKNDPAFGGGPLTLTGTIRALSDGQITGDGPMMGGQQLNFGSTAVFRVDGIDILVVTERGQMLDQQQFKAFGIMPAEKFVVALKSMQHFRAAFEPIAARVIVCDCGALSTPQMHRRPYVNAPRPIYPLDPDMVFPG